jgi:hypothetical protein
MIANPLTNSEKLSHNLRNVGLKMEHKEYGTFICLSEKGKEELRNMSDGDLEFLASIIYENILETQLKILEEINEDSTRSPSLVESSKDLF